MLAALVGCLALASGGCGAVSSGAAGYTCGHMRDTTGAFREQARAMVAAEGLRAHRLSREEAVLDAEFQIRHACAGAAAADRPYARAAGLRSAGLLSSGTAR
ncbi:MAG: hypothetical protein QOK49_2974 [Baekduia sp.]|nr:hypothetical protein [Baekduia sp.]